MKYLTIGIKSIDKDKFNSPKNRGFIKPEGGLWASPYTEGEEYKSEWHEWCTYEMPHWIKEYGVVFELKEDAKVLTIDTIKDVVEAFNNYGIDDEYMNTLDFERIAEDYDCIHLTRRGESVTRFNHEHSLYGWDVESLLVLNINCIANSYKIDIELPDIY